MKFKAPYLVLILCVLISVFSYYNSFSRIENSLQDALIQTEGDADTRVVVIGIDDKSLDKLGKWSWPRTRIAEMIDFLSQGKPAVIGFDILFTGASRDVKEDEALVEAARKAGNVVVGLKGNFDEKLHKEGIKVQSLEQPFEELRKVVGTGHINNMLDEDDIARTSIYSFQFEGTEIKSFDLEIYAQYLKSMGQVVKYPKIPTDERNRWHVTFTAQPMGLEYHSFVDVLEGMIDPAYFEDKIILIGPYDYGMMDSYYTAIDHSAQMHGVEIHGNIISNLLNENFKQHVGLPIQLLILFLLSLLGYVVFKKLGPIKALIALLLMIGLYVVLYIQIAEAGYILQIFYPLMAVTLTYLAILIYRYIDELFERKRITGVFGRYVAPQVVDQILQNGEDGLKLGGSKREITALFVDIRGFTPMSEKVEPEQVVEILNDYLNLTAQSIFDHEGTLDKFIGDATMAIFNAPLDLEDHAMKAVRAAWAMKTGSVELQKMLEQKFGRSVKFGIGVNTGDAVVGNIGAKFRMDYTAIGDTVNTAARLESNAKPDQILLSQSTYDRVKDRVKVTSLGEIKVKGKEQGISVYQLDGIL